MQVFISFAHGERADVITDLTDALHAKRIHYWHHRSLPPGKPLVRELRRAIANSAVCVFVATKKSTQSDWCKSETGAFWGVGTPVIVYSPSKEVGIEELPPQLQESIFASDIPAVVDELSRHLSRDHFEVVGTGHDLQDLGRSDQNFSTLAPNEYTIPHGAFTAIDDQLRIDVQLDARTPNGGFETCQMTGAGHIRGTFATIDYSLTRAGSNIWGGVLCLEYRPFAPTYRGYFLTRHAWDESHFAFGVLNFARAPAHQRAA